MASSVRIAVTLAVLLWSSHALAEDAFYEVPLGRLQLTEGTLPQPGETHEGPFALACRGHATVRGARRRGGSLSDRCGECIRACGDVPPHRRDRIASRPHRRPPRPFRPALYPKPDSSGMLSSKFTIPAAAAKAEARAPFLSSQKRRITQDS